MKKVFLVFFFFLLPVFSFAANFSVGGGVALTSSKSGGYGEFGVTMYNSSSFEMRNIISIDGYGKNIINNENAAGYFGITEKSLLVYLLILLKIMFLLPLMGLLQVVLLLLEQRAASYLMHHILMKYMLV